MSETPERLSELTELRRLAEGATPGPWKVQHRSPCTDPDCEKGHDEHSGLGWDWAEDKENNWKSMGPPEPMLRGLFARGHDALFIAAANPQAILRLLDALESTEERLAIVTEERDTAEGRVWGSAGLALDALRNERDEANARAEAAERRVAALRALPEPAHRAFKTGVVMDGGEPDGLSKDDVIDIMGNAIGQALAATSPEPVEGHQEDRRKS